MALNWSQWGELINVGIESFEKSHVQYAVYKQSVCNGEEGPALGPQSHHVIVEYVENSVSLLADL